MYLNSAAECNACPSTREPEPFLEPRSQSILVGPLLFSVIITVFQSALFFSKMGQHQRLFLLSTVATIPCGLPVLIQQQEHQIQISISGHSRDIRVGTYIPPATKARLTKQTPNPSVSWPFCSLELHFISHHHHHQCSFQYFMKDIQTVSQNGMYMLHNFVICLLHVLGGGCSSQIAL